MKEQTIEIQIQKPGALGLEIVELVIPDKCPICHHHSQVTILSKASSGNGTTAGAMFKCGYKPCQAVYFGYYTLVNLVNSPVIFPSLPDVSFISDTVKEISPNFYEIFLQAESAFNEGLTQIAGPGYRKALEFLIKDYASHLHPDHKDEIEKSYMGKVIADYIEEKRILEVSKRAAWLGNDETHYKRKWEDRDIHDLRELILLVVMEIDASEKYRQYLIEMDEGRK